MTCPEHAPAFTDPATGLGICDHCGLVSSLEDGQVPAHDPASFEDRGRAYHQSHTVTRGGVADAVHALARANIQERTG